MRAFDSVVPFLLIAVLVAGLVYVPAGIARARRRRALHAEIGRARSQREVLREGLAAGQLSQEAFDRQEAVLAQQLMEKTSRLNEAVDVRRIARPDRVAALGALLAAVVAGLVYLRIDRPGPPLPDKPIAISEATGPVAAISEPVQAASPASDAKPIRALSDGQIEHMIQETQARVRSNPEDVSAWALLAHSYDMLGKFAESSKAYARLAKLDPRDAQVLADYADALAVANGRTLRGEPTALIRKALAIDGNNLKALTLAGTAAYERKDFAEAIDDWSRARALSRDPILTQQIDASLASARAPDRVPVIPVAVASVAPPGAASAGISGRVSLADDLTAKASPDSTVFIFARPANGSRMPVAIMRRHVRDLPLDFRLDDSMSMVRDLRLSQAGIVIVGARVSARGDVAPTSGDLQGWSAPVRVGSTGIKLEISEVIQ